MRTLGWCATVVAVMATAVSAAVIPVPNGGFEDPGTVPTWTPLGTNSLAHWVMSGDGFAYRSPESIEGSYSLYFIRGTIGETIVGVAEPGTTYTLTVDARNSSNDYGLAMTAVVPQTGFSATQTLAVPTTWSTLTFSWTTPADVPSGSDLRLSFFVWDANDPNYSDTVVLDNVQLSAVAVPEPITLALLAMGGIGAIRRRA